MLATYRWPAHEGAVHKSDSACWYQCTQQYMLHVECVALLLLFQDVTSYIQCRGRARKRGSRYCFMQGTESPHSIQHIIV